MRRLVTWAELPVGALFSTSALLAEGKVFRKIEPEEEGDYNARWVHREDSPEIAGRGCWFLDADGPAQRYVELAEPPDEPVLASFVTGSGVVIWTVIVPSDWERP